MMRQSSHVPALLPGCLTLFAWGVLCGVSQAAGQDRYRVAIQENFRREPRANGRLLARVNPGTEVTGGEARSGWVEITLSGWIWAPSLRQTADEAFDFEVGIQGGENLRAVANGTVMARLDQGFLLDAIDRDGDWVNVRRTGWMFGRSLERIGVDPLARPAEASDDNQSPPEVNDAEVPAVTYAVTGQSAVMRSAPAGDSSAVLRTGASLRVLERSGEWVRVQTEGWVNESDLRASGGGILVGVSRSDVRSRPEEFEGKLLEWPVQYISVRTSDGLRRELPEGQPFMLARGPLPDVGFVYVILTQEQAMEAERLAPLAQLVTVLRVTAGRSRFLGNPVAELVSMSVRQP